ncbi:hypothetical protein MRB53_026323 [Persea americana]|uniref:Uncharacterized protein n=1 Tax=Persea americana TaxID=3435 RepID=A0ACC2LIU3_PERAE|nr:hypothetical protein MRB53_026323 [Persea americana]
MGWVLLCFGLFLLVLQKGFASFDYVDALTKSLLYFEAQRSGKLPPDQRVEWRGDSGLNDGSDVKVNLVGGYYDAGDNVKFGFTMAFTVTLLSWSVVEFGTQLSQKNELSHAMDAIKWGTDYMINAHPEPNVFYGEVGDGNSDHACWERPEDMDTPRGSYRIDESKPGSDVAGEAAAAMAAASIVFKESNPSYSSQLLIHAKQLFDFGRTHVGLYQNSITVASKFYPSNGYEDELLWAAAWLYRASGDQVYLDYLSKAGNTGGTRSSFDWDDKFVGVQTLVAKLVLEGKVQNNGVWAQYKISVEQFICGCLGKGSKNVARTPGGTLYWYPWNDFQYTTAALLVATAYSDYLVAAHVNLQCQNGLVQPNDIVTFVRSQVDYILGANPKKMSYMVGFGSNYPQKVHHRGASIISIKKDPTQVTCKGGFNDWFNKNEPNPNVLYGAIVGGPDANDAYNDERTDFQQGEPSTVNTAPLIGVLAKIA